MKRWGLILIMLLLTSCATGEKIRRDVYPGMARQEVIGILGKPDSYRVINGYEVLRYSNRLLSGWSMNQTDYTIVLRDGRVVEYGHGEIRDLDTPMRTAAILGLAISSGAGSGSSTPTYHGTCPCPYSLDVTGNECGNRSAWSRSGGHSPVCY